MGRSWRDFLGSLQPYFSLISTQPTGVDGVLPVYIKVESNPYVLYKSTDLWNTARAYTGLQASLHSTHMKSSAAVNSYMRHCHSRDVPSIITIYEGDLNVQLLGWRPRLGGSGPMNRPLWIMWTEWEYVNCTQLPAPLLNSLVIMETERTQAHIR